MLKQYYLLNPDIIFLNHGSFGAIPRPVFETYQYWQRYVEWEPVDFFKREADDLLAAARETLAAFLHTCRENLVFVTNATTGVNIIARSLNLKPGDHILTTNAEYGALDRAWRFLSGKKGFMISRHKMPTSFEDPHQFTASFLKGMQDNTRLLHISHISSALSAIIPVKQICQKCREAGVLTLIDGAHAPGHLNVDLDAIGADFYVGNCHKWLSAPRGAGFLYARPAVQHLIEPLIVSWGWDSLTPSNPQWVDYLQYTGTRDISAFLSVPAAIQFQKDHDWHHLQENLHQEAIRAHKILLDITEQSPFYAPASNWYRQMVSVRLPKNINPQQLQEQLRKEHHIEVVGLEWEGQPILRISVQAYNTPEDINKLISTFKSILSTNRE